MNARRQLIILGLALASGLIPSPLHAQEEYPTKPIRVIIPFPAGRTADVTTRQILAKMSPVLGQSFIIENRPGASGIIGTEVAAKAKPDGYTLYAGAISSVTMVPYLYSKLPFDMERDFVAVSQLNNVLVGLATSLDLPVKNMKELIELSKKKPLNAATSGVGTNNHLYAAWFAMLTGAKFNYIHYNTTHWGPDLMAGRVDVVFGGISAYLGPYKGGKVKLLAMMGKERHPAFSGVPTFAESGLAEFEPSAWMGLLAPTGVQQPVLDRLAAAVAKASKSPELIEQYMNDATEPVGNSANEFAAFVKAEQAKWSKVIKAANVKLD